MVNPSFPVLAAGLSGPHYIPICMAALPSLSPGWYHGYSSIRPAEINNHPPLPPAQSRLIIIPVPAQGEWQYFLISATTDPWLFDTLPLPYR